MFVSKLPIDWQAKKAFCVNDALDFLPSICVTETGIVEYASGVE